MKIPCTDIALIIENSLKKEVDILKQKGIQPKLVTFLLDSSPEQLSFVSIKEKVGKKLGIDFQLVNPSPVPSINEITDQIQNSARDSSTSGIIIQLPLPKNFQPETFYEVIPIIKEIEGHKPESHFQFPLTLAVLTGIKYIFSETKLMNENIIVNFEKDAAFYREVLKNKKIIIAGRGPTGGGPIGKAFDSLTIPYEMTHSQTINPDDTYRNADIIITATGKKIIHKDNIKKDSILLNVGLRKEEGFLRGDYDESEIQDIASFYTETPGGLGPLDVLYLYKNLIDAIKERTV